MKSRRKLLIALGVATLAAPFSAFAQKQTAKIPRVGFLFSFTPAEGQHLWEACRQGLRELGYVEGRNILLEPRWAEGRHDRLPDLARGLMRLPVDVVVAAATPANLAAKAATSTIPIVMVAVGDPVKVGLVQSLARPGGNITGLSLLTTELSGRRLQLLLEILGRNGRVAALYRGGAELSRGGEPVGLEGAGTSENGALCLLRSMIVKIPVTRSCPSNVR